MSLRCAYVSQDLYTAHVDGLNDLFGILKLPDILSVQLDGLFQIMNNWR